MKAKVSDGDEDLTAGPLHFLARRECVHENLVISTLKRECWNFYLVNVGSDAHVRVVVLMILEVKHLAVNMLFKVSLTRPVGFHCRFVVLIVFFR